MLGTTDFRTPDYFGLDDDWVETGPGEITHYHEVGTGTPVVFLHGSGPGVSAAANWWLTLPAVGRSVRAIAPDLIGYAATIEPTTAPLGIREWGAHVLRFLDALGLEQAWLVGNSLGGWIALQLAIDHPERVAGVISMGTGGAAASAAIQAFATPNTELAAMRRSFEAFVSDPQLVADEMVLARQKMTLHDIATGRLERVTEARERDRAALPLAAADLGRIRLPVVLVHGLRDHVIPPVRTWELVTAIPTADAVLLHDCGHWSQIERADAFNPLVVDVVEGAWRSRRDTSVPTRSSRT